MGFKKGGQMIPWDKKYEPTTLAEYVFQNDNAKVQISKYIADGDIPNLMIAGIQGTGKTAIVNVLINDLDINKSDVKVLNGSSTKESGVEEIRETVDTYCSILPRGDYKVVVFEEADGLSKAAQKALRSIMDKYSDTCRFVFTCNYPHMIIAPIHSRCSAGKITLDAFDEGRMLIHTVEILEKEGIKYDPEVVIDHVKYYHPDLRATILSTQQASATGELLGVSTTLSSDSGIVEEWERIWSEDPEYNKLVPLLLGVDNNNFEQLFTIMYNNVDKLGNDLQDKAYKAIADHLLAAYTHSIQFINMRGCLIIIFKVLE